MDNIVRCSKYLSYLLRHGADKHGLQMGSDGYVSLNDILNLPQSKSTYGLSLDKVKAIVENNDKKRFELKTNNNGEVFIRACQGHSLKRLDESSMMTEIVDPKQFPTVVHGTSEQAFERILTEGLKVMNRNHIHFAIGYPGNSKVISGMRSNCQVFIEVDMVKAMGDGIKFFLSANEVVLSAGQDGVLKQKYFKSVQNKTTDMRR